MFGKQVVVLRYISVVVARYAYIEYDIQDHGKIEQRKIQPIICISNQVLHGAVYSENPEGFYQQIEGKKQYKVRYKFPFQNYLNQAVNESGIKKKLCLLKVPLLYGINSFC